MRFGQCLFSCHSRAVRLLLVTLVGGALSLAHAPAIAVEQTVRVATATAGGAYYPTGGAMCRLVNRGKADHGITCKSEATSGSVANIDLLRTGRVQVGVVQSNVQYDAYQGKGRFAGKRFGTLRALFSLYSEPLAVLVRADSAYTRFDQLRGARLNLGAKGSAQRAAIEEMIGMLGWSMADAPAITELAWSQQAAALCAGQVDAIFFFVGQPSSAMQDATRQCNMRIVPIDGAAAATIMAKAPYYSVEQIPGGMYAANPNPVRTLGVKATVVTTAEMPTEVVQTIVTSVMGNLSDFKTLHPVFASLTPQRMVTDANTAPLHPAAEAYYRSQGWLGEERR